MKQVLKGCTHAIFTAASDGSRQAAIEVDYRGMIKAYRACIEVGVQRLVICSSVLVDPVNGWNLIRIMLNFLCTRGILDCKHRGETADVRKISETCDTSYTIVRPGALFDGDIGESGGLISGQTNASFASRATRADISRILIEAITSDKVKNTTFECGSDKTAQPQSDLSNIFDGLSTGDDWLYKK